MARKYDRDNKGERVVVARLAIDRPPIGDARSRAEDGAIASRRPASAIL
jgi:hypothetical protein